MNHIERVFLFGILVLFGLILVVNAENAPRLEDPPKGNFLQGWQPTYQAIEDPNKLLKLTFAVKQKNLDKLLSLFEKISDPRHPKLIKIFFFFLFNLKYFQI